MLRNDVWKLLLAISIPVFATAVYFLVKPRKQLSTKKTRKGPLTHKSSFLKIEDKHQHISREGAAWTSLGLEQPLVIAMVGLPARGKSYIVKMMIRYLTWNGFESKVFNVGSYRREIGLAGADSNFFDATNADAQNLREEMAMKVPYI